jgi:hypothetical protein
LPQPFGPTIPMIDEGMSIVVKSANDLNPLIRIWRKRTKGPLKSGKGLEKSTKN